MSLAADLDWLRAACRAGLVSWEVIIVLWPVLDRLEELERGRGVDVGELFERHNDEFLKFERIPESLRRHPRPDLCAMLYLHDRFGGTGDAVVHAEHDEVWLDWSPDGLTEPDVVYLLRCGVRYDAEQESLAMFV